LRYWIILISTAVNLALEENLSFLNIKISIQNRLSYSPPYKSKNRGLPYQILIVFQTSVLSLHVFEEKRGVERFYKHLKLLLPVIIAVLAAALALT
jgi:hypothetical protein